MATLRDLKGSAQVPAFIGSLFGVLCAWKLADAEWYLFWSLLLAAGLFGLGQALSRQVTASQPSSQWGAWLVFRDMAGILVVVAWLQGPSLLALFTAFWALRFFSTVQPLGLRQLADGRVGLTPSMVDLAPSVYAFVLVLLPLRLLVDAPWSAGVASNG